MAGHERLDEIETTEPSPALDVRFVDEHGVGAAGAADPTAEAIGLLAVELFAVGEGGQVAPHGGGSATERGTAPAARCRSGRAVPCSPIMPLDSDLVKRAAAFAREAHDGHFRKDAQRHPYFVHLDSVARRLAHHGHKEDEVLAAAYLHDVLEDRPAFGDQLRVEFPPLVVSIVEAVTEQKFDQNGTKRSKHDRFEDYLAGLKASTPITRQAIPISCADKLDNTESMVAAERRGDRILDRLTTRPDQHGPQLARLREIYEPIVTAALLAAFDTAVQELLELIAQRTA